MLRKRHGLKDGEEDDFTMITPDEIIKFLFKLSGTLVIFLSVTGLVTLIVAGFVLANLFILSVSERTQEIGIRRAVGAKKKAIFYQFLLEASIITIAGGVLGFIMGLLGSYLLVKIAEFPLHFSWKAFAVGLILSLGVGIGFGIQPANKAANLNPIEAIR
jgi:putative ABC transport system permease protein